MAHLDVAKLIRRALILLAGSALCVFILTFIFTDAGAHTLFRLGVASGSEDVDPTDTAHLEYFEVKRYTEMIDSYRVFLDGDVAGSWTAALDFLKFVKQNSDVNTIWIDGIDAEKMNAYLASGDPEKLTDAVPTVKCRAFVGALYNYNQSLPPQKRVMAVAEPDFSEGCYVIERRIYDNSERAVGVLDVSMLYPGSEGCDPLFNIPTPVLDADRIRFGSTDGLDIFIGMLELVSGNFGCEEFRGMNQPEFFFLIETAEVQNENS